jgi:ribosomal protein S26
MGKHRLQPVDNASLSNKWKDKKQQAPVSQKIQSLTFDAMIKSLKEIFGTFPDTRSAKNSRLSINNAAMGAFAVFFTQTPSFLSYQKRMQDDEGRNNAQSLFGISQIISDSHIRRLLDRVPCSFAYPMFSRIFYGLLEEGFLDQFRSYKGNLLVALDATGHYSSRKIHCKNCSKKHHQDGSITYGHSVITPVVVHPDIKKAISLRPEFIIPQDGHKKQDCENAAAKRFLKAEGPTLKKLQTTILGDDLYCHQPFCELVLKEGLDFILICKESSHSTLYEYVKFLKEDVQTTVVTRYDAKKEYKDTYRFLNNVPLLDAKDAPEVNWCELVTTKVGGTSENLIYKNAFATNFVITKKNVRQIVNDGRTRWKIENENNNTLKTKGYHLEHNFGHGEENLSSLLITLNLLAFLFHTALDLCDEKFQLLRKAIDNREEFFQRMRNLTVLVYFECWSYLMDVMLKKKKLFIRNPDDG